MHVLSIVSTKGGVGKTTVAANLGGFAADAGLRVLLLDLDVQPALSSYFGLDASAAAGVYELLAFNDRDLGRVVSRTAIGNLDLVLSNDDRGQLPTLLLHASDGRLRLRNLLTAFRPHYDLMLIDTQGARSVLLEMAVLASDSAVSPVTPEVLAAREFRRGTVQLMRDIAPYRHLGIEPPPLHLLLNRVPSVSSNAQLVQRTIRDLFRFETGIDVLETVIPSLEVYPRASAFSLPVHRVEPRKPSRRTSPAAFDTMRSLARELLPMWDDTLTRLKAGARWSARA